MTEYEQWLDNKEKYGEFETEDQFWSNQENIIEIDKEEVGTSYCPF